MNKPGVNWDEIRRRFEAHEPANAIAKTVDVSKQAILSRAKKHGWKKAAGSNPLAKRQATKATQLATLATDPAAPLTFKEWFGKDTPETRRMVIESLQKGATQKLAAQAAGISENTLSRWKAADEEFAMHIEAAKSGHAIDHIGVIDSAGKVVGDWKASAFLLGRNPLTKGEYGEAKAGGVTINVQLNVARGSAQATTIDVEATEIRQIDE